MFNLIGDNKIQPKDKITRVCLLRMRITLFCSFVGEKLPNGMLEKRKKGRQTHRSYLHVQCNRCNLQYIGETKRRLKDRFNEHRRTAIDNPNTKSKPTTAAEHFLSSPNHTANNMQLIPIEKNVL